MRNTHDTKTFPAQQKVLTVLIPTYNGEATVARALISVIDDIETNYMTGMVDVIVMDNGSADSTYQIVSDLASNKEWIGVYRSPENLGLDSNLRLGMAKSQSLYTKILSDDDVFVAGYLANLVQIIISNDSVDLIISSMSDLNESIGVNSIRSISKQLFSMGDVKYLEVTGGAYGQLSTLCFKNDSWSLTNESPILKDYIFNGMEFIARVYHLTIYGSCIWDESRLLLNDTGPKRWNQSYLDVFLVNSSHALFIYNISLLDQDSFPNRIGWDEWMKNARKSHGYQLILDFISLKRSDFSLRDDAVLKFIPSEFSTTRFNRYFLRFLEYIPKWLCTLIVRLDYVARRIRR